MPDFRPRLKGQRKKAFDSITKEESRVLVIGDIHEPFCKDGYLEFCIQTYQEKNCSRVVFIGDIIDNHYSSYHETDPDGLSGGMELSLAISKIQEWSKAFPVADVIIGNHDRMIMRKAFSSSIPKEWIKSYNDVLGTDWVWHNRLEIDGVQYVHGEGGTAKTRAKNDGISTVQGHIHTQAYVEYFTGIHGSYFGCQVGCGVDSESYAMAYAKAYKKPQISCAVVIGGHTACPILMQK